MSDLLYFLQRLHFTAGYRLYINLISMLFISFIEGIGIYLIVPLLGVIGVFNFSIDGIPIVSGLLERLEQSSVQLNLTIVLLIYLVLIIGQALLQRNQAIMSTKLQQSYIQDLRKETYRALLQSQWSFFLGKRKSDFNEILSTQLIKVSHGVATLIGLSTNLVFTAIQIVFALWLSVEMTAIILITGTLLMLFSRRYMNKSRKLGAKANELSQSYFAGLTDHFNGIKDIKSNRLEHSHIQWFYDLCAKMEKNYIQFVRVNSSSQVLYKTVSAVLVVFFVYAAIGWLKVGAEQLILIVLIFSRLWPRFMGIQSSLEQFMTSYPSFKILYDLQRECAANEDLSVSRDAPLKPSVHMKIGLECRNVYYRYDASQSSYALSNINIEIPSNQMTAIVGKSGAGKSTLLDLLMGLIEPEKGEVLIDNKPLSSEEIRALRASIGYVAQDPFLFNGSLKDNLRMVDPDATDEQLWNALKFSASDEFVRKLPQQLDTIIGDRGIRLSGGERQRIVLARAILKRPAVLVLDEATSALDSENEHKIKEALDRLKGTMTIIVIAHRLSTIRNADQVIVLDKGEVVQQGGYYMLSQETRGTFRKLLHYQADIQVH